MTPLLDYPPIRVIPAGPFALHTWGLFVAAGALLATAVAARRAARAGISPAVVWDGAFWILVAGLVGARLLFVIEYWREFVGAPWSALAFWEGGMSAFGSVILAPAVGIWYARRRGLNVWTVLQAVAPAALLADAIGRLGGAASHMYPGTPTAFPLSYVVDGVQRHEVGVELAAASFVGFLVVLSFERVWKLPAPRLARRLARRSLGEGGSLACRPEPGRRLGEGGRIGLWSFSAPLVLGWYSAERFLLDFLRAADLPNSDLRYGGLTLAQWLAIGGVLIAGWVAARRGPRVRPDTRAA